MNDKAKRALVLGAGLAGLAAALELAERGVAVTVLESGAVPGGKVRSWKDADGDQLEHSYHACWKQYRNFLDLVRRVGGDRHVLPPMLGDLRYPDGFTIALDYRLWPAPLHLATMFRELPFGDKLALAGPLGRMLAYRPGTYGHFDRMSFSAWARQAGIPGRLFERLYRPLAAVLHFLDADELSAAAMLNSLHFGLLGRRDDFYAMVFSAPPGEFLFAPLLRRLRGLGAEVLLSTPARALRVEGRRVTGVRVGSGEGERWLPADQVISAVPVEGFKALLRGGWAEHPYFARARGLRTAPVMVSRLWFDRPAAHVAPAICADFELVDLFVPLSQLQDAFAGAPGLVVEIQSIRHLDKEQDEIEALILRDLRRFIPELAGAKVRKHVLLKHRNTFTAFDPGSDARRPTTATPLDNLWVAGDWVKIEHNSWYMERAVASGRLAAAAALRAERLPACPVLEVEAEEPLMAWTGRGLRALGTIGRSLNRARLLQ